MIPNKISDIRHLQITVQSLAMGSLRDLVNGSSDEVIEINTIDTTQQERSNTTLFQDDSSTDSEDSEVF